MKEEQFALEYCVDYFAFIHMVFRDSKSTIYLFREKCINHLLFQSFNNLLLHLPEPSEQKNLGNNS